MSVSEWRTNVCDRKIRKTNSKEDQSPSKIQKDFDSSPHYNNSEVTQTLTWRVNVKDKNRIKIEVKDMPDIPVAYIRHIGPYKGDSALFESLFIKLMTWAGPSGLLRFPETQVLSVYHDDPDITDEDKLRTSACISVPEDTQCEGEVGRMSVPGGKYAVARF